MKELSIEEKAKAYDEALEKARQLCAYPTTKPFINDLQDLFPELQEPEDERIKKTLINFFSKGAEYDSSTNGIKDRNIIAWLEKQGEEKVQAKSLWHEYNHPIDKDRLFLLISKNKRASIMLWNGETLKSVTFGGGGGIILEGDKFAYIDELQEIQNSAEWSEEEEKNISQAIYVCHQHGYTGVEKWLKSLKDKYTWKPSDEQITVLELASKYERVFTPKQIDILIGLKEQLKKLKVE